MANIPLRAYIREIEGLIDSRQYEDAISHCRHILQIYPKHIDTYRLLGKVFLESKQFSNAADILQRVLSTIPDDFVSHIGMSIIREDEGNLDAALWHMERAFESKPSNKAIQDELRRLYGRRDGMEPPKIRLTRGALAQMYVKGNLYDQAIAELRGALSEDPQRQDLLSLLAQMNFLVGNKVEAVETCSNILKRFPYNLMANRILALILPQTERGEDAKIYQQRSYALDPYLSKAGFDALTSDDVPDGDVLIATLERKPSELIEGLEEQPAWAETLGIKFEGTGDEELPDWLTEEIAIPSYEGKQIAPFVDDETQGPSGLTEDQSEERILDWMISGDEASTDEQEILPSIDEINEIEVAEDKIEKADIPEWLKEYADANVLEEASTITTSSEEALPPWLDETTPGPTDSIISWLEEKEESSKIAQPESEDTSKQEINIPEWLLDFDEEGEMVHDRLQEDIAPYKDLEEAEELDIEKIDELPEWLKDISDEGLQPIATEEIKETSAEQIIEQADVFTEPEEQIQDAAITDELMKEVESETTSEPSMVGKEKEIWEPSEVLQEDTSVIDEIEMPDWLRSLDEEDKSVSLFDEIPEETTEIPKWLQELGEEVDDHAIQEDSTPTSITDTTQEHEELTIPEEEVEAATKEGTIPSDDELPAWVQELDISQVTADFIEPEEISDEKSQSGLDTDIIDDAVIESTSTGIIEDVDETEEEAGLAWLESLVEKQVASDEELIPSPEVQDEETPDWIPEEISDIDNHFEPQIEEETIQEIQTEAPEIDETEVQFSEIQEPATIEHEIIIDLNTGSLAELERIPGVGFVIAQSIIDYREQHGPFIDIQDLINVPEIGDKRFEAIKDHFTLHVPEESPPKEGFESIPIETEKQRLENAIEALEANDIILAAEIFDYLIKSNQNLDEIISTLETKTSQEPENILLLQTLGDAYLHNDQFQKALDTYTRAEKLL